MKAAAAPFNTRINSRTTARREALIFNGRCPVCCHPARSTRTFCSAACSRTAQRSRTTRHASEQCIDDVTEIYRRGKSDDETNMILLRTIGVI